MFPASFLISIFVQSLPGRHILFLAILIQSTKSPRDGPPRKDCRKARIQGTGRKILQQKCEEQGCTVLQYANSGTQDVRFQKLPVLDKRGNATGHYTKGPKKPMPLAVPSKDLKIFKKVKRRAHWLDRAINICGFRIGVSAIFGLVPVSVLRCPTKDYHVLTVAVLAISSIGSWLIWSFFHAAQSSTGLNQVSKPEWCPI